MTGNIYILAGLPVVAIAALAAALVLRQRPALIAAMAVCVIAAGLTYRAGAPLLALNNQIDLCDDQTSGRYVGPSHPDCEAARSQTESYLP